MRPHTTLYTCPHNTHTHIFTYIVGCLGTQCVCSLVLAYMCVLSSHYSISALTSEIVQGSLQLVLVVALDSFYMLRLVELIVVLHAAASTASAAASATLGTHYCVALHAPVHLCASISN